MKQTNKKLLCLLLALLMLLGCGATALADEEAPAGEPFAYDGDAVNFIKADGSQFGMFTPQEGTTAVIKGGDVVIHYVPKNTTVYRSLHFGPITDELTADVTFNEDGSFDFSVDKANCGKAIPVAPIKTEAKGGGTTGDQYYLAIPAADKLADETPVTPPPVDPPVNPPVTPDETVELAVENTTGMFKLVTAALETKNGSTELVFTLSGKSYHYLYRGSYAQAVANGDARANWVAGEENAEGLWEFRFPVTAGTTVIPLVSISQTYLDKYDAGENPLERSFFPRQLVLDAAAKLITSGDYDQTMTVSVTSRDSRFQVASTAQMRVVGGPNSNNYNVAPVLRMLNDTFDQVVYPTVLNNAVTTETAELGADNSFAISMLNAPKYTAFQDKEPISMSFREKATGEYVTFPVTIDQLARTITIGQGEGGGSSQPVTPPAEGGEGEKEPASLPFTDVDTASWYYEAVSFAYGEGLMQGVTAERFAPEQPMTRAMVVTVLYRLAGEPEAAPAAFADVAADAWYAKAVNWAAETGVTLGTGKGFAPEAEVTREQLVTFLHRYAVLKGVDVSVGEDTNILSYDDAFDIAEWAIPAMQWACGAGVITGRTESTLAPQGEASRAEIAAILQRALPLFKA